MLKAYDYLFLHVLPGIKTIFQSVNKILKG